MSNDAAVAATLEQIRAYAAQGLIDVAAETCRRLLESAPQEAEAWSWLGLLLTARGRWAEAEEALRKAIALSPNNPHYWSYLSDAVRRHGRAREAEAWARQAIAFDQRQPSYWVNLGAALNDQQRWGEAAKAYRESVRLDTSNAAAWQALGSVEHDAGRLAAAQEAFERAVALAPEGDAVIAYANLLGQRGEARRAIEMLIDALKRAPQLVVAWEVLYRVSWATGERELAEWACRQLIGLVPQHREARYYLADLLVKRWELPQAEAVASQLVADAADYGPGWLILGMILGHQPAREETLPVLRRAMELDPRPHCHSVLLGRMQYADGVDARELLLAHQQWDAAHARPLFPATPPPGDHGGDKLTLGFLSPNLSEHPVSYLALPALELLDKARCKVVCYSDGTEEDRFTERFRAASSEWHNVRGLLDETVAERIRDDKIDILFDLSGHFEHRLAVFARKPAPVQVTWLGYVGTTGLSAIDFLLADRFHVAGGEENLYSESVLRMPNDYACYGPPDDAPEVAPLPALGCGKITFGCFNNPAKFSRSILDTWAEILRRLPESVMLFKFGWLGPAEDQRRLLDQFARRGVEGERILIEGGSSRQELLGVYGRVDLALDTQPYSGGLTTCEALWMGVPVITFPGKTFAGRHSTSHLTNAGYPQFVAENMARYIELAVEWAGRLDELAAIRWQMREQVRRSPLCDARRFARDFLAVLCQAWEARCDVGNPSTNR